MQAIQVTYKPHSLTKSARVIAKCKGGSITKSWDYDLTDEDNYINAAYALLNKLCWHATVIEGKGTLPDDSIVFTLKNMY